MSLNIPCDVRWLSCEPLLEEIQLGWYIDQIQWIVVGGESGKNARKCQHEWIDDLISQAESKLFVKQLGSNSVYSDCNGDIVTFTTKHPKGGDIDEFPEYLKVRELPF